MRLINNSLMFRYCWRFRFVFSVLRLINDNTFWDHKLGIVLILSGVPLYCATNFFSVRIDEQFIRWHAMKLVLSSLYTISVVLPRFYVCEEAVPHVTSFLWQRVFVGCFFRVLVKKTQYDSRSVRRINSKITATNASGTP